MSTSADNKTIDRESLRLPLEKRYSTQKAGGAYNVQTDVKTEGTNELSIGSSISDNLYTIEKGFKLRQALLQTQLKDAQDTNVSRRISKFIQGFNNKKYFVKGSPINTK